MSSLDESLTKSSTVMRKFLERKFSSATKSYCVLLAMFQSDMKENKTQKIPNDMKTEAVAEMINFIYAGNVSNANVLNNMARALLSAAKPYQLNMLRSLMLSLSISIGNGMQTITHAGFQPIYCLLPNKEGGQWRRSQIVSRILPKSFQSVSWSCFVCFIHMI